ncbi:uncharacterized protein LOC119098232, partial [Pollicipes pollicipes]|uniref:uncharacterized protein LOC119098232 n=1 Tax=Pollicipes pollicipes TaxID=41117 RepID=UPI001884D728
MTGVSVTPLYLAPGDRLRFTAENASQAWSEREAEEGAGLVLAAWDQTASPELLTVPGCQPMCGGSSSLSEAQLRVLVLRSDCTDLPVLSAEYAAPWDVCGRCGGTGESCIDCNQDVNGTAFTDCERCVGGATGLEPERDCAHQCMESELVRIQDAEVCALKEPAAVAPCDSVSGSGAYYNPCGHCVLGTTGLTA